jgi:hypothetical protein
MQAIGLDFGFIVWLVGIVLAVVVGAATLLLNIQKWVIIAATAALGAGTIVGTFLFLFGGLPPAQLVVNPVRHVLQTSPFWLIVFVLIAVLGGAVQYQTSRWWQIESYNRLMEEPQAPPASDPAPDHSRPAEPPASGRSEQRADEGQEPVA